MKLSGVLVICLTYIILRATATYVPVVLVYNYDHSSLFLLVGFLSLLLLSLPKRKPLTAATSTDSTTSATRTTTIPPPRCSIGYTFYPGPGRSFCYRYSSDCKTWDDARTACQMERADLTSLDVSSLVQFSEILRQQFPGVLAILLLSLRTRRSLPVTTSTTSTTITTANPRPQCNAGYTLYSGPGRSLCFRYLTMLRSWDEARTACQLENADLPVLDSESLISFSDVLRQQFPGVGSAWLRAKTDGNLNARYIGGSTIQSNSRLWVVGEPNTPNDCILLVFVPIGANLADQPCGNNENYVCQHF